jgi:hypothetical protein
MVKLRYSVEVKNLVGTAGAHDPQGSNNTKEKSNLATIASTTHAINNTPWMPTYEPRYGTGKTNEKHAITVEG